MLWGLFVKMILIPLYAVRKDSPLIIGLGEGENFYCFRYSGNY